jgi:hypothetical protein
MRDTSLPDVADRHNLRGNTARALPAPALVRWRAWGRARVGGFSLSLSISLTAALLQGLLYMLLLPPWQHYDEPTHFEYAWLIANRTALPHPGDEDQIMRREVAASMLAHNFFYQGLQPPSLLTDQGEIWLGVSELNHPPLYYTLVSLPLRAVRHLDVTSQLYVARGVSLLLFLLTVAVAWAIVRELTPRRHVLRWAAPTAVALLPPFADVMTSVNNDVGAVLACSLFLWGCVRAIRGGLSWRVLLWVAGAAAASAAMKNTGAVALPLAPLALGIALWVQRGWRWRWLAASALAGAALLLALTLGWGDAAYWYRWSYGATQLAPTRAEVSGAPFGSQAVLLELAPNEAGHGLVSPLPSRTLAAIAGKTVTVGGWVWSDRPVTLMGPGPLYVVNRSSAFTAALPQRTVGATPTLVLQTFQVPANTTTLHLLMQAVPPPSDTPIHVYLDGAFIIPGTFPADTQPQFDSPEAAGGVWAGRPFTNLVRNASAEQSWPYLRPWLEATLFRYIHRSPSQTAAALFDLERVGAYTLRNTMPYVIFGGFGSFAWGQVRLQGDFWIYLFCALLAAALCGGAAWLLRRAPALAPGLQGSLLLLGLALALIWLNVLLRPLPLLDAWPVYPTARYGFPAIAPSMLALTGGWAAVWPKRWRRTGAVLLLAALVALNAVAVVTIAQYFNG